MTSRDTMTQAKMMLSFNTTLLKRPLKRKEDDSPRMKSKMTQKALTLQS